MQQLDLNVEMNRQLGMVWHPARTQSRAMQEFYILFKKYSR
jgi:hypothetical protein